MLSFAAHPPRSVFLTKDFVRHPRLQALTDNNVPVSDVMIKLSVSSIELSANLQQVALNCDTESLALIEGTLEGDRLRSICTPVLTETGTQQGLKLLAFGYCDNSVREKDWRCRKCGPQAT